MHGNINIKYFADLAAASLQIGRLKNRFTIGTEAHIVARPTAYRPTLGFIQPHTQRILKSLSLRVKRV